MQAFKIKKKKINFIKDLKLSKMAQNIFRNSLKLYLKIKTISRARTQDLKSSLWSHFGGLKMTVIAVTVHSLLTGHVSTKLYIQLAQSHNMQKFSFTRLPTMNLYSFKRKRLILSQISLAVTLIWQKLWILMNQYLQERLHFHLLHQF
jgi:hypothetical protein